MTVEVRKYLSDVLIAIEFIQKFTQDTPDFNSYQNDIKTQSATERQLAIIGEAINKIHKIDPILNIENDKQIIAFRNRLIHAYGRIDNAIIWTIIKKYLPKLKEEIERISA